jgi:hypothetical protein
MLTKPQPLQIHELETFWFYLSYLDSHSTFLIKVEAYKRDLLEAEPPTPPGLPRESGQTALRCDCRLGNKWSAV